MITDATISVIGVLLLLVTAWGYYFVPARKRPGRGLFMLLLAFAVIHLIGDGLLRSQVGEPADIAFRELNGTGMFYFSLYLIGVIGVLQMGINLGWVQSRKKDSVGTGLLLQIPAIVLVLVAIIMRNGFTALVIRYMPLLYALVLFFMAIWFYERLDRGVRIGMLAAMAGCVLSFVVSAVFHIIELPLMVPVLLVTTALSWDGRGEMVLSDVSEEELERLHEKGYIGEEITEESDKGEPVHTVVYSDRAMENTAMLPELERMMRVQEKEKASAAGLSLDDELPGEPAPVNEVPVEPEIPYVAEPVPTPVELQEIYRGTGKLPEIREEDILAAGMRAIDPTPMEQLTAATALTAESDSQSEDAMHMLEQVDDTVSDVIHSRPLIMEKDLNEYYHRMKTIAKDRDYDACLEILSEMSEYRISGIHLTRYERIRHAVLDQQWKEVERALKDY